MALQIAEKLSNFRLFSQKISEAERLHEEKLQALRKGIENCKRKLHLAQDNFDYVTEPKLVDFYIYKIQAEQSRYEQLLLEYRAEEQSFIHPSVP